MRTGGRIFYGWVIVGSVFLILGIGVGNQQLIRFLIQIFAERFNTSSGVVSFCTAGLLTLVAGVAAPFCGILINRYSSRTVMVFSLALIGAGYVALAFVTQIWQVAAIYALIFSLGTYGLTIAGNAIVCEWFEAHRGRALGLAMSGMILVGFLLPPIAAWALENLQLRTTFLIVAVLILALIPVAHWLIVDKPAQMGLVPDGVAAAKQGSAADTAGVECTLTLSELATNRCFWTIAAIVGTCHIAINVPSTYFVPFIQDAGIPAISGSYLLSAISAFTLAGTLMFGRLSESLSQRTLSLVAIAAGAITCLILLAFSSYSAMLVAAIVTGLGAGMVAVLPAVMVAANLGRGSFALAFGTLNAFMALTYSGSLFLFGQIYDALGSAKLGLQAFLIALAVTLVVSRYLPSMASLSRPRLANAGPKD